MITFLMLFVLPPLNSSPTLREADAGQDVSLNLVYYLNHYRQQCGLSTLPSDPGLMASAQAYAEEMARTKNYQHSPKAVGYNVALGENIGRGQVGSREVTNDWIGSSGHARTMRTDFGKQWKKCGVGFAKDSNNVWYWVQHFSH